MPNRPQILDEIITPFYEGEQLRQLLKFDGLRASDLLRQNPKIWYNMLKHIQYRAQRAKIALADENTNIKNMLHSLRTLPLQEWPRRRIELESCLLWAYEYLTLICWRRDWFNLPMKTTPSPPCDISDVLVGSAITDCSTVSSSYYWPTFLNSLIASNGRNVAIYWWQAFQQIFWGIHSCFRMDIVYE